MNAKHGTLRFNPRAEPVDPLSAGPWDTTLAVVHLDVAANTVAIGANVMVGAEKLRVVGAGLFEGSMDLNLAAAHLRIGLVAGSGPGSAAATGGLRMQGNGAVQGQIVFRNTVDGGDVAGMSVVGGDSLRVGGLFPTRPTSVNIDATNVINIQTSGSNRLIVAGAATVIVLNPLLSFFLTVLNPTINQADDATPGVAGDTLLIHAQDTTGGGGDVAGDLDLRPGNGTTDGALHLQDGAGGDRLTITSAGQVTVDAASILTFQTASGDRGRFTSTMFRINPSVFAFHTSTVSPIFRQENHTGAGFADTLLIHAQDTDLAGADTGGDLDIRPGTGTTGGQLALQDGGGVDRVTVSAASEITLNAATGLTLQTGGGNRLQIDATNLYVFTPGIQWQSAVASPILNQADDATPGAAGDTLLIHAQNTTGGGGDVAGDLGLRGGLGSAGGDIWLHVAPANFQAMEGGLFMADAVTVPSGNPAAGVFLYATGGTAVCRGSGGTVTTYGPAKPHCVECGYDFWDVVAENERFKAKLMKCGWCGHTHREGPDTVHHLLTEEELTDMV